MLRLASILFSLTSTVFMGSFIVALLTLGMATAPLIIAAVVAGFVLGAPVAWLVARQLYDA